MNPALLLESADTKPKWRVSNLKKRDEFDVETIQLVAEWFYRDRLKTPVIEKRLIEKNLIKSKDLTERTVEYILEEVDRRQMVKMEIAKLKSPERDLEDQLRTRWPHLDRVILVPRPPQMPYKNVLLEYGKAAASYFDWITTDITRHGKSVDVGISGGESLFAFVTSVPERVRERVHIHTTALVGRGAGRKTASGAQSTHIDPLVNAMILWDRCGGIPGMCHYATVPPLKPGDRSSITSQLERLAEIDSIGDTLLAMDKITVAFVGLGVFKPDVQDDKTKSQLSIAGLLEHTVPANDLNGVLGDLSYVLFDKSGVENPKWRFFLSAGHFRRPGLKFYQNMVTTPPGFSKVVVLAGMHKETVLIPALQRGLFNVWITDDITARYVLARA